MKSESYSPWFPSSRSQSGAQAIAPERLARTDGCWQTEDFDIVEGFDPDLRPTERFVGTIHDATSSGYFHLISVDVRATFFDSDDWLSLLIFAILLNFSGVHVNDGFGWDSAMAPTGSGTSRTSRDDRFAAKERDQPHFSGFVRAFDSTGN